eukprot:gene363-996_t
MSEKKKLLATAIVKPNTKNCFVELSNSLARHCSGPNNRTNVPAIVCVEDSFQRQTFVSWSAHKGNVKDSAFFIYIGKHFADSIHLTNGDMVYVYPVKSMQPCSQVFVVPVKSSEWDMVELNSKSIEQNLLNQIRIVSPGLTFPLFLKGSAVVQLKIEAIIPKRNFAYLEEFTELNLAPAMAGNVDQGSGDDVNCKKIANQDRNMSEPRPNLGGPRFENEKSKSSFSVWESIADILGVKTIRNEIQHSRKLRYSLVRNDFNSDLKESKLEKHTDKLLRVHPIALQDGSSIITPFQSFVDEEVFHSLSKCGCHDSIECSDRIVMHVCKVKSPSDKRVEKKKGKKNDQPSVSHESAIIEVCRAKSSPHLPILPNNMATSDVLRHHLRLQQGDCVRVKCLSEKKPSTARGIVLTLLENQSKLPKDAVIELFRQWIRKQCSAKQPEGVLLNNDVTIEISHKKEPTVCVALSILTVRNVSTPGQQYFRINENSLGSLSIVVNEDDITNHSTETELSEHACTKSNLSQTKLGGVEVLLDRARNHLANVLDYRVPLGSSNGIERQKGSLLICGSSRSVACGSGRTSFARRLSNIFEQPPYFAHIEIINCTSLRGKKPENIVSRFVTAFKDARWKQPSVLVLDDLDNLIFPSDPVKDAEPTIVHQARLSEGLKDILREEMVMSNRVALIIVSKSKDSLHEVFNSASGWHFVSDSIVLAPPDLEQRESILKSLTETNGCCLEEDACAVEVAKRTEGFLPADVNAVVCRAKHYAIRHREEKDQDALVLSKDDFEEALSGYKPLGLHGIDLHRPGEHGWDHVGGLGDVKKILQETFTWPIKYPNLFSKCSLRMRSGVLLYGPPGTGKTLLAGVIAKECGMNFVSIKGPELLSKYVGSSEQNVRDLFARAQSASPCILFFDEFDALAPKRGHDNTGVTDRVVNQLLTQLDGVEKLDKVFILAATSRPDLIDPALLRPGRLDKCVFCSMPNEEERCEILKALSNNLDVEDSMDFKSISEKTKGFSGADIKALLYNAQLKSIHRNYPSVSLAEVDENLPAEMVEDTFSLQINQTDVEEALEDTGPSVTNSERKRYEKIYENFMALRKGSKNPANEMNQRVTLA